MNTGLVKNLFKSFGVSEANYDKITRCMMSADMSSPVTEKDSDEMDYLKFKLSKL
jgi:hypothetical protein